MQRVDSITGFQHAVGGQDDVPVNDLLFPPGLPMRAGRGPAPV